MQYSLRGARSCGFSPHAQPCQVTVQFECAATQASDFTVAIPQGSCNQTYTLQTPLACMGPPPPPRSPCGVTLEGHIFDFSTLSGLELTGSDGSNPPVYTYMLSVCSVLSSAASAPCTALATSSSACQQQLIGGTGVFDQGDWPADNKVEWEWIDPNQTQTGLQGRDSRHTMRERERERAPSSLK